MAMHLTLISFNLYTHIDRHLRQKHWQNADKTPLYVLKKFTIKKLVVSLLHLYIRQHGTYNTSIETNKTPCYVSFHISLFNLPIFKVLFTFPIFLNHRWTSKACMFISYMTGDGETNSLKPLWKESGKL